MTNEKWNFTKGERIEEIPKGANTVTIRGFCFDGDGRHSGAKMMEFARKLGCFSPGNNQLPGEESLALRFHQEGDHQPLIDFLNGKIADDCEVSFSKRD